MRASPRVRSFARWYKGILRRLHVCPETLRVLEEDGITAYVLQTEEAVDLYNRLRGEEPVGGLFHSTC